MFFTCLLCLGQSLWSSCEQSGIIFSHEEHNATNELFMKLDRKKLSEDRREAREEERKGKYVLENASKMSLKGFAANSQKLLNRLPSRTGRQFRRTYKIKQDLLEFH